MKIWNYMDPLNIAQRSVRGAGMVVRPVIQAQGTRGRGLLKAQKPQFEHFSM